ncbi:hypothetical protein [Actinokineospora xionganensis]|uniref:Uncharacterized protein n=1 Tax=Actinokineospora xionganensis TaxID=2684470 RepID=A0ABR7LBP1_9PSEU|nr:hypothetical protein [Actinokineospora xionganensis]MBC6450095.1 hypothetical protein [Actinokineospora xionganensis]
MAELEPTPADTTAKPDGFQVKVEESDVVVNKKFEDETVEITLNVNHTVDAEGPEED